MEFSTVNGDSQNEQEDGSQALTFDGGSPGPPELKPDHSRCIIHFDIDSFYAQARYP